MGEVAIRLLAEARKLPAEERIRLAKEIVDSVDDPDALEWERAWRIELDRRLAEMEAGNEEVVSLDEVRERLVAMATP